jgi:hypothetical protein
MRQLEWYRTKFMLGTLDFRVLPGTLDFRVPRDSKMEKPDCAYKEIKGVTIYIVNWELNCPAIYLNCFNCEDGKMIDDHYKYKKNKTLTPALDVSGQHAYALSMSYTCSNCGFGCKGKDGRLLHKLPHPLQLAYPVDQWYYAVDKNLHLSKTTIRIMASLMTTHGNGDFLSRMLLKL